MKKYLLILLNSFLAFNLYAVSKINITPQLDQGPPSYSSSSFDSAGTRSYNNEVTITVDNAQNIKFNFSNPRNYIIDGTQYWGGVDSYDGGKIIVHASRKSSVYPVNWLIEQYFKTSVPRVRSFKELNFAFIGDFEFIRNNVHYTCPNIAIAQGGAGIGPITFFNYWVVFTHAGDFAAMLFRPTGPIVHDTNIQCNNEVFRLTADGYKELRIKD